MVVEQPLTAVVQRPPTGRRLAAHPPMSHPKGQLVAAHGSDERGQHDEGQIEIAAQREEAAQQSDGLAFEKRADQHRHVAVLLDQITDVHVAAPSTPVVASSCLAEEPTYSSSTRSQRSLQR